MPWKRILLAVVSASVIQLSADPVVHAASFDPGDFTVSMNNSSQGSGGGQGSGKELTCTVGGQTMTFGAYWDNIVSRWSQAGNPPTADCSMVRETRFTNAAGTGSVTNANVGTGDMAQTCDMNQSVNISFTYAATVSGGLVSGSVSAFKTVMTGYQACAWAMTFHDARTSRLSGTIEQTFSMSGDAARAVCPSQYAQMAQSATVLCVPVTMSAKVFVVGGTGYFAGTSGDGTFTETDVAPVVIPRANSVSTSAVRAMELALRIASVLQADSTTAANGMKLALLTGARTKARLVSPAAVSGTRTLGVGPDGTTLVTVKVAVTPGAKCDLSVKSGTKSRVLVKPATDADGMIATSVTAATLKSKLSVKPGAKVALSVYCSAAGKSVTAKQDLTVGA